MLNHAATHGRTDKKPFDNKVNQLADVTRNLAPNFGGNMNSITKLTMETPLAGAVKVATDFNAIEEANNLLNSEVVSAARKLAESVSFGK